MAGSERDLRTEAVRRRLTGESPEAIARSLGRSTRWVQKWVGRRHAGGQGWSAGQKRGPRLAANRAPAELERQVIAVRERLAANPWAQVGADAIAWELEKVGVEPPPRRTLERIVARSGATRQHGRARRPSKGVPYPAAGVERRGRPVRGRSGRPSPPRRRRSLLRPQCDRPRLAPVRDRDRREQLGSVRGRRPGRALGAAWAAGEAAVRQRWPLRRPQGPRPRRPPLSPSGRDPAIRAAERTVAERNGRALQ